MALELELDPLSAHASTMAGMALLIGRRYEEAEHACREALDLQPDLSNAVWHLSFSLLAQSRPEHALDLLRTVRKATARLPIHRCLLGHALACAGQDEEARAVLEELRDRSRREYVSPFMLAKVHIGLGELDEALDQLEKTYAERSPTLLYLQRPSGTPYATTGGSRTSAVAWACRMCQSSDPSSLLEMLRELDELRWWVVAR